MHSSNDQTAGAVETTAASASPITGATAKPHGILCALDAAWKGLKNRSADHSGSRTSPIRDQDLARLRDQVAELYGRVATAPEAGFHFNVGAEYAAATLGYDRAELAALPRRSTQSFAGVGNPHAIEPVLPGETVVDIGCGCGTDLLIAARRVGPTGHATGVDMTEDMVSQCRASLIESGLTNVEVVRGDATALPLSDDSADVVISNGALNLVPDKGLSFSEIFRVLRPGGRLMFGDVVLARAIPQFIRSNVDLWALCVGGALRERALVDLVQKSGFEQVHVTHRFDCAKGTSLDLIARLLGVQGINLYARKPAAGTERA
jgi:SAM-dependent methyltransferase